MALKTRRRNLWSLYAQVPFWVIGTVLLLHSSPAIAANECGATANGGTATCNGDGTPATDANPFAAGITYSNPVNLVVDGTNTTINTSGRIGVTSNAGAQTTTTLGNVNITRTGSVSTVTLGDYSNHARNMSLNISSGTVLNLNRTTPNGFLYAMAASSSNGVINVNSGASITAYNASGGTTSWTYGILANDFAGGVNSVINVNNSGHINITQEAGVNIQGIYAGSNGVGTSTLGQLTNTGEIEVYNIGGTGTACYGIGLANNGSGGGRIISSGNITIEGTCATTTVGVTLLANANGYIESNGEINIDSDNTAYGIRADALGATNIVKVNNDMNIDGVTGGVAVLVSNTTPFYDIEVAPNVSLTTGGTAFDSVFFLNATNSGTLTIGQNAIVSTTVGDIGFAIEAAGAADTVISRGLLSGKIHLGGGVDSFTQIGGSLDGDIEMQGGDDELTLDSLDAAGLQNITHLSGGTGTDTLTLNNVTLNGHSMLADNTSVGINFSNDWENINLTGGTNWTLTGNLVLGGSTVTIDSTSTLFAGNGINSVIESVIPGDPAVVINEGVIDLTNGATGPTDTLTIRGNYVGNGGVILMDAELGDSSSPTDRIIFDGSNGGSLVSGTTQILVNNAGGLGALTTGNGILLIETTNGATVAANSFTLATRTAAGAYDYQLNLAPDNSFYLTTSAVLTRPEVVVDSAVPDLTHTLGLQMLGTYHNRAPARDDATGHGYVGWARTFTKSAERNGGGNFAVHGAGYDSDITGVQVGMDMKHDASFLKQRDVAGFYVGAARSNTSVAQPGGGSAGQADMTGYTFGTYWTRQHAQGWYTDAVLQATYYADVDTRSSAGVGFNTDGMGVAASVEAGKPISLADNVTITPQVQAIYQAVKLKDGADTFGQIDYDLADAVHVRTGVRIAKKLPVNDIAGAEIWLTPNVWHSFSAKSTTNISNLGGGNTTRFDSDLGGTRGQIDFGIAGYITSNVSIYAAGDYSSGFSRTSHELGGRLGLKVTW